MGPDTVVKILLYDLSQGAIGEKNANLLGSLILTKEKLGGLSRQNIPEKECQTDVLGVGEAQNFVGDYHPILSEPNDIPKLCFPMNTNTM